MKADILEARPRAAQFEPDTSDEIIKRIAQAIS